MRLRKLLLAHGIKPMRGIIYYRSMFTMLEREMEGEVAPLLTQLPAEQPEQQAILH